MFLLALLFSRQDRQGGNTMYDVAIIGCGVIGASLAYTLSRYDLRVLVLLLL